MPAFWRVMADYGLVLIVTEIIMIVADDVLSRSAGIGLLFGLMTALVALPALIAGVSFGRIVGRAGRRGEVWRFAVWFSVLQVVLALLLMALAMQDILQEESDGLVILVVVLACFAIFCVPVSYYAFGFSVRLTARTR